MNHYLDVAIQMARDVGGMLLEHQNQTHLLGSKSTTIDLVTEADERAQQEITQRIRHMFPDHNIIAEEGDLPDLPHSQALHEESEYVWVIDPIDGTTNYWHGSPHFCVSIALCHRAQPIVGVIGAPRLGDIFWSAQGEGAWRETNGQAERLHVSTVKRLDQAVVATGFPYERAPGTDNNLIEFGRVMPFVQGIRRAGSAALDLAYVAAGWLDGYWEFHVRPWDTMAGQVLVREAGGTISPVRPHGEMHGAGGILATNGPLHMPLHRQIMGDA